MNYSVTTLMISGHLCSLIGPTEPPDQVNPFYQPVQRSPLRIKLSSYRDGTTYDNMWRGRLRLPASPARRKDWEVAMVAEGRSRVAVLQSLQADLVRHYLNPKLGPTLPQLWTGSILFGGRWTKCYPWKNQWVHPAFVPMAD